MIRRRAVAGSGAILAITLTLGCSAPVSQFDGGNDGGQTFTFTSDSGAGGGGGLPDGAIEDGGGSPQDSGIEDGGAEDGGLVSVDAGSGPRLELIAGQLGGPGNLDGVGIEARLNMPQDVALDALGTKLFIADSKNDVVRVVDVATAQVTTPTAAGWKVGFPLALYREGGSLYVSTSSTVRKLDISTGAVAWTIGSETQWGSTDGIGSAARFGTATALIGDGAGNLYVSDSYNHTIRKIDLGTQSVSTIAGAAGTPGTANGVGTAARFDQPEGAALDGMGNLYVADRQNQSIRKMVLATGAVSTLSGTVGMLGGNDGPFATATFYFPSRIISDGAGNLYVTEAQGAVRRLSLATQLVSTVTRLKTPSGMAWAGSSTLFVADPGAHAVLKVKTTDGTVSPFAAAPQSPGSADGTGAAARFNWPAGIAADATGNLFVVETVNQTLRKIDRWGVVTTVAGKTATPGSADGVGPDARLSFATYMISDGANNLYFTEPSSHTIRRAIPAIKTVTTLAGIANVNGSTDGTGPTAQFNSPGGLALDGQGNLFIADGANSTIRRMVLATREVTTFAGSAENPGASDGVGAQARFYGPYGLAFGGQGRLYVADSGNHTIRLVDLTTGAVTTLAGQAGQAGHANGSFSASLFSRPSHLAFDSARSVLWVGESSGFLRRLDLSTQQVTTPIGVAGKRGVRLGALPASLSFVYGLLVLPDGTLAISDGEENAILRAREQ